MIASRGPAPFLLVRIIIAQVCVSVNLYFIELNSKMVWKNNPNTEDVLSNRAMYFGLLNYGASSDINYPYRYTTFYISISDSWASTIISVPYSTDTDNKIHFGLYDKSSLTWTWV